MDRKQRHSRTNTTTDPFALDPFWDSWDEPKAAGFDSESDEEKSQSVENFDPETDWSNSAERAARRAAAKRHEKDRIDKAAAALAATKARMKRKTEAAALEEAKAAASAAAMAAAEKETWRRAVYSEVDRAMACVALAKPVQALQILFDVVAEKKAFKNINQEEQNNIVQMYEALYNHYVLQKSLSVV